MADLNVANTILEQLGGSRFVAMVGAKQLVGRDNGLTFRFMRNSSGSNRCEVRLDQGSDTYTVLFYHVRSGRLEIDESFDLVYADGLRRLFESHTGLATHL